MKGAIDPVTETDFQCQEIIIGMIRQAFPDHGFLAEETAGEGVEDSRPRLSRKPAHPGLAWEADPPPACRWIIDPLDGTVNFAHGYPAFCVSIACEADGVLEYGVIYDPLRDELFEAQKRAGGLASTANPSGSPRPTGWTGPSWPRAFPMTSGSGCPRPWPAWGGCWAVVQGLRRGGSAALDLCYVACGRLDGFFEENLKPWDTAAGLLIVTEAGGKITTFDGGDYDIYAPNILASNGVLHKKLLDCLV